MFAVGVLVPIVSIFCLVSHATAQVQLMGTRFLDVPQDTDRTSVMVQVKNTTDVAMSINGLTLNGQAMKARMAWDAGERYRIGRDVDWCDIRPRTLPPGQAGTLLIGYARRSVLQSGATLGIETSRGRVNLKLPPPAVSQVRIADFGFSRDLDRLTLMVRNDGDAEAGIEAVSASGQTLPARIKGPQIAPGGLAVVEIDLPQPAEFGQDCCVLLRTTGDDAIAWFRAHPAEVVTYMYYSRFSDARDLAEKHIAVGTTHHEHSAELGFAIEQAGEITAALQERIAQQVKAMREDPSGWAWYMQDDAGWGRPRPQTLVDYGNRLRAAGSKHLQILCNPADNARYAWLSDAFLNYWYPITHHSADPTVFPDGRSIELMRQLNEPLPLVYLVDTIGQGVRWITPAEEELASYAMLGRGARHLGWFVGVSLWEQGGSRGGGVDWSETRPWRYQEGATACVPVWNHVGKIAAAFRALAPSLAISSPLAGELRPDRIEILPLLTHDDLIITTLLNRNLRSIYPEHFAGEASERRGGIKLVPQRSFTIRQSLPEWITPARVLAFDHDRGVRELPSERVEGGIEIHVDALDSAAVLVICPTAASAEQIAGALRQVPPAVGGSPIRPDRVLSLADARQPSQARWQEPNATYRAVVALPPDVQTGQWVTAELATDAGDPFAQPIGAIDAPGLRVFAEGNALPAQMVWQRNVWRSEDGIAVWQPSNQNDPEVELSLADGLLIESRHSDGYATIQGRFKLDPAFDLLELSGERRGRLVPLLSATFEHDGQRRSVVVNLEHGLPQGRFDRWQVAWRPLVLKEAKLPENTTIAVTALSFSMQVYDGVYTIRSVRQLRSRPAVYFQAPQAEDRARRLMVYWSYLDGDGGDADAAGGFTIPESVRVVRSGELESFGISDLRIDMKATSLDALAVMTEARARAAWVEVRSPEGTLRRWAPLATADGRRWRLDRALAREAGEAVDLWISGSGGYVFKVELSGAPAPAALTQIARVSGQIETLAAAPDGAWVLAGAERVFAHAADGAPMWEVDLATHRRQQERYGPGRNVEHVEIRQDGRAALAFTYAFDLKAKAYQAGILVALAPDGRTLASQAAGWEVTPRFTPDGQIRFSRPASGDDGEIVLLDLDGHVQAARDEQTPQPDGGYQLLDRGGQPPKQGVVLKDGAIVYQFDYPPYPLHRQLTTDGRVLVATTQGIVQLIEDGKVAWQVRREARIDALIVLEQPGLIAIAYKVYPDRFGWRAVPFVELLDLSTGAVRAAYAGAEGGDFGGFGTDLQMAASRDGRVLYVGDQAGRIYRLLTDSVRH